ncbi:FAD-dependent oxidoreductase [Nocardioides sp. B-3]|uniref:FAD-dependent oxidoreductase n=1 Tax=Nocardioides sp. B-3 TaxID=2895565 RepID=UPI003FA59976
MPDIPGFAEQWGRTVHVCPFCHGHELSGKRVAIRDSPNAGHAVAMLSAIAGSIKVVPPVTRVAPSAAGLVVTSGSTTVVVDGLFAHPTFEQAAPFAAQLGLELRESGAVAIDLFGHTSVPGVFAAGDRRTSPSCRCRCRRCWPPPTPVSSRARWWCGRRSWSRPGINRTAVRLEVP